MSGWIGQHFLHPSFVLPVGAVLIAVPVIIHLINRLRYRRVRFAAMEFLLKSERRNRRRLFIEQILLLLLRIGIVGALVALVARLVLDPSALWAFRGARSHHVVLLDDSGSMRDRWGETSAFREGLTVVRRLIAEGVRRPGTQQFTLLLLSQPDRAAFLKREVNTAFAAELETTFERLECTHQPLDLVTGIEAAAKLLVADPGTVRHFHVVSDFRASDWGERTALRSAFLAVAKTGTSIDLERTVKESHDNLAVTNLTGDVRTAAAGVPVRLKATIQNFGSKVADDVRLTVLQDGSPLPRSEVIGRLEPGKERQHEFDITFKAPGKHTVEIRLPEDSLLADGQRYAALDINLVNPVLIIDGNPEGEDSAYVENALAADSSITGFSTKIEGPDFLSRESLENYRCIYLLNIAQLRPDSVEILADYVRHGGGLAWFLGDTVNTSSYNKTLHDDANGLFPVRLAGGAKQQVRADESSLAADISFIDHPIFRILQGPGNPFVDSVRINAWIPVADDWVRDDIKRRDNVKTLAFLTGHEPFAFERSFGSGRILAFLTTAGPKWNDWVRNPSTVVFQLELAKYLARQDHTQQAKTVGEPIQVSYDPAEFLETVEIVAPEANGERITRLKATQPQTQGNPPASPKKAGPAASVEKQAPKASGQGQSVRIAATYPQTDRPGIYIVRLFKDQSAAAHERWIAYNVSPAESHLKVATTAEILNRLSGDLHVQIHEPGAFNWIEGSGAGQEARTLLLSLLAVALVMEQVFAHRLSHHPTAKGAA
jgi:hypothetical protein